MTERAYPHTTYPPATDEDIAAVERKFGITYCDDYKAFLKTDNGLEIQLHYSGDWIYEVHRFFGLSPDQKHGLDFEYMNFGFFDRTFLPICYPVGEDGGGNLLLQIAAGKRRGELAMLDHEVFHGGMDKLLTVEDGHYPDDEDQVVPFRTFAEASPDHILDECFKQGFLAHYPVTLAAHLTEVDRLFGAYAEELRTKPKERVPSKVELHGAYLYMVIADAWKAVEKLTDFEGDRFTLMADEVIAWHYSVTMEETRDIAKTVTITAPQGRVLLEHTEAIETNGTYASFGTLAANDVVAVSGTYAFELRFPDDADLPVLVDTCELNIGERKYGFTSASFDPATEAAIAACESKLTYRFCDDFRAWLLGANGIHFAWPHLRLWNLVAADDKAKFTSEIDTLKQRGWELSIAHIEGLQGSRQIWSEYQTPPQMVEVAQGLARHFETWNDGLHTKLLCPVATAYVTGSDGYYQVTVGANRGKIVELLVYRSHLDHLSTVGDHQRVEGKGKKAKTFRYPFKTIAEASPEQIIQAWADDGMIRITDMTFTTFSERVIAAHEREFEQLFDAFIGKR